MAQFMEAAYQDLSLPAWLAHYPVTLTSPSARQALWARARRLTGNEDFGFALAERMRFEVLGSFWRLCQVAPSLRALHESSTRWYTLLFDFIEPFYEEQGERIRIGNRVPAGLVLDRSEQDLRAAHAVKLWRTLHRRADLSPLSVNLTYARPRSLHRHHSALGTHELCFGQGSYDLFISRQLFDAPLPTADAQEFARLDAAASQAASMQQARSLSAEADAMVTWLLGTSGASAEAVARKLGVSVRSLRRRLAEEGRSFRVLIDGVRQREALLFVETGLYTMKQLALRVGFANDRALRHALRRWRTRLGEH